jgi:hypothetical protein
MSVEKSTHNEPRGILYCRASVAGQGRSLTRQRAALGLRVAGCRAVVERGGKDDKGNR